MAHPHEGPPRPLGFHVLSVTSSRGPQEDASGAVIVRMIEAAGHVVRGRHVVPETERDLEAALRGALAQDGVDVVVVTGGTGVSARDRTPSVVRGVLDRELPGFGEAFRARSWEQVGVSAMLSDAVGGTVGTRGVFAVPGSHRACALAMEALILPVAGHLVSELRKEVPAAEPHGSAPVAPVAADAPAIGWQGAVAHLGATLAGGAPFDLPPALARLPAVQDVLASATQRAWLTLPSDRRYLAFGFPDLVRPASRVLLVQHEDVDHPEMVALHRWPRRVGVCGDGGLLAPRDGDVHAEAVARTGREPACPGTLFAVEGDAVHVIEDGRVRRWDGSRVGAPQPRTSALGSLVLAWSQR
jgi:molybdenum cofactor biosynthesis protein B